MLNAVLLLFLHQTRLSKVCYYAIANIFLYHYTRLSEVCFYAVVKISLKFLAIYSKLSAYHSVMFYVHCRMFILSLILKHGHCLYK